jgi:hypothetical protein
MNKLAKCAFAHKERQQMESTVKTRLQSLQLGEAQTSERMASYRARRRHVYE